MPSIKVMTVDCEESEFPTILETINRFRGGQEGDPIEEPTNRRKPNARGRRSPTRSRSRGNGRSVSEPRRGRGRKARDGGSGSRQASSSRRRLLEYDSVSSLRDPYQEDEEEYPSAHELSRARDRYAAHEELMHGHGHDHPYDSQDIEIPVFSPPPVAAAPPPAPARKAANRGGKKGRRKLNGFMKFANTKRTQLRQQNPGWSMTQVGRELGRLWRSMGPQEKEYYNAL